MNSYTITEVKVKTFYTIQIGPDDLVEITQAIAGDPRLQGLLPIRGAFSGGDLAAVNNASAGDELLQRIWSAGAPWTDTKDFIVREVLGFDGVENYGYFDENIDRAVMVVYRYGDRLNADVPHIRKDTTREPAEDDGGGVEVDAPVHEEEPQAADMPPPVPPKSMTEVIKAAAAAGMSYGQYVQATEPRREQTPKAEPVPPERDTAASVHGGGHERHSAKFKEDAVKFALSGECSINEAAQRMNIKRSTLYEWVRLYKCRRC